MNMQPIITSNHRLETPKKGNIAFKAELQEIKNKAENIEICGCKKGVVDSFIKDLEQIKDEFKKSPDFHGKPSELRINLSQKNVFPRGMDKREITINGEKQTLETYDKYLKGTPFSCSKGEGEDKCGKGLSLGQLIQKTFSECYNLKEPNVVKIDLTK